MVNDSFVFFACLDAVMPVTEWLPVCFIPKQLWVSLVRDYMVHVGCYNELPVFLALHA